VTLDESREQLAKPTLHSVRAKHHSWQIALENGVYVAVQRPTQTAQNVVVFDNLEDMDGRLDELDGR
jgi:hypothetical protein